MMYGHADLLATLGQCAAGPACQRPPVAVDDAGVRRCAVHALELLLEPVA